MEKSNTKRTLIATGLSVLLCIAMLIGTTLAWFSDTVSNKGNRIQAGNLKVGFAAADSLDEITGNLSEVNFADLANPDAKLFQLSNWQPGDIYTRYMRVKNTGTLALKYNIGFVLSGENNGIADAIQIDVTPAAYSPTVENGTAAGAAAESIKMNGKLAKQDDYQIFKVTLKFLESAGNSYNAETANTLDFGLDVILTATQDNNDAVIVHAKTAQDIANAPLNSTIVLMKDVSLDEDITIGHYVNFVLNGYTLNLNGHKLTISSDKVGTTDLDGGTVQNGTIEYNIPTGSGYAGGTYRNVNLNVRVSEHTFTFAGITDGSITMNAGKLVVKEGGQVESVTVPAGSSTSMIDNQGQIGKLNNQSGSSVTVTGQPPEDFDGDISVDSNEWIYKSKEPQKNGSTYTITSAEELAWISKQVKGGNDFSGITFELTADLDLSGKQWTPIGYTPDADEIFEFFNGTFNGNGHTIKGIQIGSASAYDDKLLCTGLFGLAGSNAVIHDVHAEAAIYTSSAYLTGGFVGLNNGSIYNCSISGNITYNSDVNECYGIGGFAGAVDADDVSMINCSSNMQISADLPGGFGIGGFIGTVRMVSRTSIANCYAAGSLQFIGPWDGCTVGGFIGYTMWDSTNLRNCFTTMDVTAKLGASVSGNRSDKTYAVHAFEGWFYSSSITTDHNFIDSNAKVEITKTGTPSDIKLAPSDASTSSVVSLAAAEMNNYWTADNLPTGFTLNDLQIWSDVSSGGFPVLQTR